MKGANRADLRDRKICFYGQKTLRIFRHKNDLASVAPLDHARA